MSRRPATSYKKPLRGFGGKSARARRGWVKKKGEDLWVAHGKDVAVEITKFGRSWEVGVYVRMVSGEWKRVGERSGKSRAEALDGLTDLQNLEKREQAN